MTTLASRLKEAICARKISQKDLAEKVGISPSAITQILNGSTKELKAESALRLSRALNIDPWWLVMGEGSFTGQKCDSYKEAENLLKEMPESNLSAVIQILKQLKTINNN